MQLQLQRLKDSFFLPPPLFSSSLGFFFWRPSTGGVSPGADQVWPDAEIKSSPNFSKSCQKCCQISFIWKGTFFKIALKSLNIWATFKTKYFTQNFRKSSILVTLCVISSTYLPTYSWYFFQKRLPYLQSRYLTHLSKHFIRWSRRPCWTKEGPQSKGLQDWLYNILDCLPIHQSEVCVPWKTSSKCGSISWPLSSALLGPHIFTWDRNGPTFDQKASPKSQAQSL